MDWQSFLSPWNIGGGLFGLLLGIATIVSLVANRRQIGAALVKAAQRLFSPVGFFGLVILIFMVISVLESGQFFNNITHHAVFGLLGYAIDVFRARERKRVEMLQVRLNTERELLTLDTELSTLRRNREQASGKVRREWIFWRWLRPGVLAQSSIASDELKTEIDQAVQATRAALEEHLAELRTSMHTLSTWSTEVGMHLHTLQTQMSALQEQERTPNAYQPQGARAGARTRTELVRAHSLQSTRARDQQKSGRVLDTGDREHVRERVLATFHQLGIGATDTDVARASGYSRTTVARWRKRFVAQGQLPAADERAQPPLPQPSEITEEPGPQNQIWLASIS